MTELKSIADPRLVETTKSPEERAEDVAYTLNHAISCGLTDVFTAPLLGATWHATTGKPAPLIIQGCLGGDGHDHTTHHHTADHHEHSHGVQKNWLGRVRQSFNWKTFKHHLWEYSKGEVLGDAIAVPLTIGVQRTFPGFMHGLRNMLEPMVGGIFRRGAHKASIEMAKRHDVAVDAPEVKAREEEIYEHEVSHLPQAVVWNMFAFPISIVAQGISTFLHDRKNGNITDWKKTIGQIALVKTGGSIISNGVLIGGRMAAPEHANHLDRWQSKHILLPATKVIGKAFGVDEHAVDRLAEKQNRMHGEQWQTRMEKQDLQKPTPHDMERG